MDQPSGYQRPPYLHLLSPSTISSAYQSSSSLASVSSTFTSMSVSVPPGQRSSAAPLPSPTAQQPGQYFGSLHTQTAQPQQVQQQQREQQTHQTQQRQQGIQERQTGCDYRPDRGGAGATAMETTSFLNDYSLLAEAAKRAQMACLERDLGGVELH